MEHNIVNGNIVQLNWELSNITGGAFSPTGYAYRLYYVNGSSKTLANGVTHSGGVLTWTFIPNAQWKRGHYDLWLELYQNGEHKMTLTYLEAFRLLAEGTTLGAHTAQSGEDVTINISSSCDFNRFLSVPTVGDDGKWYINGAVVKDGHGNDVYATGRGITTITKTATAGKVDTYTITYSNNTTQTFTVTNGNDGTNGTNGVGITKIEQTSTAGKVDTYTITLSNNQSYTFTVTNGNDGEDGTNGTDGDDGITPIVTVTNITGGHNIAFSYGSGDSRNTNFNVLDGQDGAAAGISELTASVDGNVGTPSVTVTPGGTSVAKTFNLAFHNLKGTKGDTGAGLHITGVVDGTWADHIPSSPSLGDAYYSNPSTGGDGKLHIYGGPNNWFEMSMSAGTLDTTETTAQSTNASESLAGNVKLHKVSKTGAYSDLSGTPTIPTVNNAAIKVKGAGTDVLSTTANASVDASVDIVAGSNVTVTPDASTHKITIAATDTTYESKSAASGGTAVSLVTTGEKYAWNNKSDFSGNYNDLSNKPTIPAAQIQADWNQTTTNALDYIKNKPTIPTIPGVFSTSANGLVPAASTSGDTDKFLKGDGTWATPSGGGSSSSSAPVTCTLTSGYITGFTLDPSYKINWFTQVWASTQYAGAVASVAAIDIDDVFSNWCEMDLVVVNDHPTAGMTVVIPATFADNTTSQSAYVYLNGVLLANNPTAALQVISINTSMIFHFYKVGTGAYCAICIDTTIRS